MHLYVPNRQEAEATPLATKQVCTSQGRTIPYVALTKWSPA